MPHAGDFVVADFNETTSDFSGIIDRINARFKTDFRPFIHTQENMQAIFSTSRPHLHPTLEREQIKSMFKDGYLARAVASYGKRL